MLIVRLPKVGLMTLILFSNDNYNVVSNFNDNKLGQLVKWILFISTTFIVVNLAVIDTDLEPCVSEYNGLYHSYKMNGTRNLKFSR